MNEQSNSNEVRRHCATDAEKLRISALDQPSNTAAHNHYVITGFDLSKNPHSENLLLNETYPDKERVSTELHILFQNGHQSEVPNGVTLEALIAICIDRLDGFQQGQFACVENDMALIYLEQAIAALHGRTLKRLAISTEMVVPPTHRSALDAIKGFADGSATLSSFLSTLEENLSEFDDIALFSTNVNSISALEAHIEMHYLEYDSADAALKDPEFPNVVYRFLWSQK